MPKVVSQLLLSQDTSPRPQNLPKIPSVKEYALSHVRDPIIIEGLFLNPFIIKKEVYTLNHVRDQNYDSKAYSLIKGYGKVWISQTRQSSPEARVSRFQNHSEFGFLGPKTLLFGYSDPLGEARATRIVRLLRPKAMRCEAFGRFRALGYRLEGFGVSGLGFVMFRWFPK